jgi:PKD repeat protein
MKVGVALAVALALLAIQLPLYQLVPSPQRQAVVPWFYDDMRMPDHPPAGFVMPVIRTHGSGAPDYSAFPDYSKMNVTDQQLEGPAGARTVYPLIKNITMSLSFEYDATVSEFQAMDGGLHRFADLVYDYTDGQINVNQFDLYNNQANWNGVNVHILNQPNYRANAQYGGISYGGIIQIGRDAWGQTWDSSMGAIIIAHEFGHWALFLPDEYDDNDPTIQCYNDSAGTCIMSNPYSYYEICTDESHNAAATGIARSCWSYIKEAYPTIVEIHGKPDPGPTVGPGTTVRWHYPDLYVRDSEMTISTTGANEGDNLTVSLPVHNPEKLVFGSVKLKFYLDQAQPQGLIQTVNVTVTNVDSVTASFKWKATGGTHRIIGVVDPDNVVSELNKNNNTASKTITVNGRPVISQGLGGFLSKEDVPISVRMTQYATDPEDSASALKWSVVKFNNRQIASVGTGASQTLVFTPVSHWWGTTPVTVSVADTAGLAATKEINLTFTFVNYAPETVDPSWSAPSVLRGKTVELSAAAIDVEDRSDMLDPKFEWRAPGSEQWTELSTTFDGSRFSANVTVPMGAAVGRADARIAFVDTGLVQGEWYWLNSSIAIMNNRPAVTDMQLSADTVTRGEFLQLTFNATDPETAEKDLRPTVEYRAADGDWGALAATPEFVAGAWQANIDVNASWVTGSHDFRILVNDSDGAASSWFIDSDALNVVNSLPKMDYAKISRTKLLRNETAALTISASDYETGKALLAFEFKVRDSKGREQNGYVSAPEHTGDLWQAKFQPPYAATAGKFTITVRVGDADGGWSDWYEAMPAVDVQNNQPTAAMWGPDAGVQGNVLWFDGSNSSDPENHPDAMSFSWSFGDGTPAGTGLRPSHTYLKPGSYRVTLTLTDRDGAVATVDRTLQISARPSTAVNTGAGGIGTLLMFIIVIAVVLGAVGAYAYTRKRRAFGTGGMPPESTAVPPAATADTGRVEQPPAYYPEQSQSYQYQQPYQYQQEPQDMYDAVQVEPEQYVDPAGQPYPENEAGQAQPTPFPPSPGPGPEPDPLRPPDPEPGPGPYPDPEPDDDED